MHATITSLARRGGYKGYRNFGLGDDTGFTDVLTILTTPYEVNGRIYDLTYPVLEPNGWYAWTSDAQEQFIKENGGVLHTGSVDKPGPTSIVTPTPTTQNPRPTPDYVRAGDVVRITMQLTPGIYLATGDLLNVISIGIASANLRYINGSTPGVFTGQTLTVDVQPQNDYSHLVDIASTVQAILQSTGTTVVGPATAAFVSQVEQTGGKVVASQPPKGNESQSVSTGVLLLGVGAVVAAIAIFKN